MPTKLQGVKWFPSRGLNTAQPPHEVPMDMASDGFDVIVNDNKKLTKRDGFDNINGTSVSASATINSFGSLYLSSGTNFEIFGTSNGGVWQESAGVVTASVFSGLSTTQPFDYTQFLDSMIVLDGNVTPRTWTGSASGTISAAASASKYGETHLNKFFLAGMSYATSRVDYSTTGDFNVWTGTGTDQFQVSQNDGQDVTGLKSFSRNELVIFKDYSMYKLIGYDKASFNLMSIDTNIGCVNNKSIQNYKTSVQGGILIFAYRDGIYVYDGATAKKVSSYIQDFWDTLNQNKFINMRSCIDIGKGRYMLSVTTGSDTTNSRIIVIDLLHPWQDENGLHFPIWIWRVSAQGLHTEVVGSTNLQRLVFGDTTGFKHQFGTFYSDNGATIESYVTTPLMAFTDGLAEEACLRRIYTAWESTAGSIEVSSELKDGTDWVSQDTIQTSGQGAALGVDFQIGVSPVGLPEATFTHRSNTQVRSRRIKARFLQDSTTRYFTMQDPVEFYYKTGGQRR